MKAFVHLALLGNSCREKVTGHEGVVTEINFDLFGCIQALVTRKPSPEAGESRNGLFYDVNRLDKVTSFFGTESPVLPDEVELTEEDLRLHLKNLGFIAVDKATGFKGVVTSVNVNHAGMLHYLLDAGLNDKGENIPTCWFLPSRLSVTNVSKMACPNYEFGLVADGDHGCVTNRPITGRT